jgi:hypothetical protein
MRLRFMRDSFIVVFCVTGSQKINRTSPSQSSSSFYRNHHHHHHHHPKKESIKMKMLDKKTAQTLNNIIR